MSALQQADREKLAKLLGLLASNHPGEQVAAATAAVRFLKARNLTWEDALNPRLSIDRRVSEIRTWRSTCSKLLDRPRELSPWERRFVEDLPRFTRLSSKQRHWLSEISLRVLGEHL